LGQTLNVLLIILITVGMALITTILAFAFDLIVFDSQVLSINYLYGSTSVRNLE